MRDAAYIKLRRFAGRLPCAGSFFVSRQRQTGKKEGAAIHNFNTN